MTHLSSLRTYPACLLFYASGLGALAAGNYKTLATICRGTMVQVDGKEKALNDSVLPWSVLDVDVARQLPGYENRHTPINDRLFETLRDRMRDYLPDDSAYEETFDRFEYLTCLVELDIKISDKNFIHAPVGRFG